MNTIKKLPFDLAKALAGAKLVTRDGEPASDFGHNPDGGPYLPFKFIVAGRVHWANEKGRELMAVETSDDLFLLDESDQPAPEVEIPKSYPRDLVATYLGNGKYEVRDRGWPNGKSEEMQGGGEMLLEISGHLADEVNRNRNASVQQMPMVFPPWLTERKFYAAMALQGIRACTATLDRETACKIAAADADALMAELNKEPNK